MPRSFVNIWIHAICATKNRQKLLAKNVRMELFRHIHSRLKEIELYLDVINGVEDHIHCLFRLSPTQNISLVIKNLKGESSRWINENKLTEGIFEWQEGYGAFSVSPSAVSKVRNYILDQETYHGNTDYKTEINILCK